MRALPVTSSHGPWAYSPGDNLKAVDLPLIGVVWERLLPDNTPNNLWGAYGQLPDGRWWINENGSPELTLLPGATEEEEVKSVAYMLSRLDG